MNNDPKPLAAPVSQATDEEYKEMSRRFHSRRNQPEHPADCGCAYHVETRRRATPTKRMFDPELHAASIACDCKNSGKFPCDGCQRAWHQAWDLAEGKIEMEAEVSAPLPEPTTHPMINGARYDVYGSRDPQVSPLPEPTENEENRKLRQDNAQLQYALEQSEAGGNKLLIEIRDCCLFSEDKGVGVTTEPHISEDLFSRICEAINRPTKVETDGVGWCSSCDEMHEVKLLTCPKCDDYLVFASDDKEDGFNAGLQTAIEFLQKWNAEPNYIQSAAFFAKKLEEVKR